MKFASCHPSNTYKFEVVLIFLENICIPALKMKWKGQYFFKHIALCAQLAVTQPLYAKYSILNTTLLPDIMVSVSVFPWMLEQGRPYSWC